MKDYGLLLACLWCLVPYLLGVVTVLVGSYRAKTLGRPWGFLPFGGWLKEKYQDITDNIE